MKTLICTAIAVAVVAFAHPAQAYIIIPTTNSYTGIFNSAPAPGYDLTIAYDVIQTGNLYEYDYTLQTTPAEALTSFSIGGALNPINTTNLNILLAGGGIAGTNSASVAWSWGLAADVTDVTVSFTSPFAPTYATFTASDDDLVWSAPANIPAPDPVPEPSSFALVAASAFIFGLFRYRQTVKRPALAPKKIS